MADDIRDYEVITNASSVHLNTPDSLGIYNHIGQVESFSDNTSVLPIPPGSPAYASSIASSTRETHINDFQQYEPYRDDPDAVSPTQLQGYTSFDGPVDTDDGKCPTALEEDSECSKTSSKRYQRKLKIAIVISTLFFILELFGGWIAGSLALLSDSFHLLSDIISFAISILSIYLAQRPTTRFHSYGYHRAEILGALASIILIWALTGYLCLEAYYRLQEPTPVDGPTMCIVASVGVFVNIVLLLILGQDHGHSHDHNHNDNNINVRAALLHVLGDLLSSLGVLISSIVITLDQNNSWVDPLCTFLFSALVMFSTFGVLRSSIRVLMEATPLHIDALAVRLDLEEIRGVKGVHDLHIWDLTVGRTTLTAHLRLHPYDPDIQPEPLMPTTILADARRMLKDKYGILQVTIQVEY